MSNYCKFRTSCGYCGLKRGGEANDVALIFVIECLGGYLAPH